MKMMKKVVALLLAQILMLAMVGTAFAADTGSITVNNPLEGQTYTAYKIFDVSYNADKSAFSYTIKNTDEWYDVVNGYAGLTKTPSASDPTVVVVEKNDDFSAPAFANILKAEVDGKTGTDLTASGSTVKADNLPLGYYFVTSTSGALCNLTTTTPDAVINDKNDMPFEKTDGDTVSLDVGQVVNYKITGKVPDTTGFITYTYKVADTMSAGLTFNNDVVVKIGGTEVDASSYTLTNTTNGFELTIPVMDLQDRVGEAILIEYSATINKDAVAKIEKNKATLTYSNDPTDETKTTTTPPEEEEVYTSKIVIDKYAANDENKKLEGAKFVLYKEGTSAEKLYYKVDGEGMVTWVADKASATEVETDAYGEASFDGLANGTYYLEETVAPEGYNLMAQAKEITISGGDTVEALTVTAKVPNSTGTELPQTGGIGTTIFYVLGATLMVVALLFFVARKRMGTENESR